MKFCLMILVTLLINVASATETFFCSNQFESLPIQQGGRVKPLYVHAMETIKDLTGKSKVDELSAVEAYCLLSFTHAGLPHQLKINARVDHVKLMEFLGLKKDQHELTYDSLIPRYQELQMEAAKFQNKDDSYTKSINKLLSDINLYQEILSGENWMLAVANGNDLTWSPASQVISEEVVSKLKEQGVQDPFGQVILNSKTTYDSIKGTKYLAELYYAKMHLSSVALLLTLAALACMALFKNIVPALILSGLTVIVQITLFAFRIYISGRAPVTNMYETVLFSGFGSLLLGLTIGHFKQQNWFVYMGLAYNLCTLMMINFANGMLSATISPLVPVLRDNFWLSTHVSTIMLSYGALALSWVMANTALIKKKLKKLNPSDEKEIQDIIYTTLKWGTTLLAAGIILGGVWADYSWGRFWGWDPKETWSLIVLCIYMALLHGRYTAWIKNERFILITAASFLSVMMAWFGVNYILATGLHSYGFSEGGAVFLGSFFLIQIVVLIWTSRTNKEAQN